MAGYAARVAVEPSGSERDTNITHDINFGRHSFTLSERSFWEKRSRSRGATRVGASERGQQTSFNGANGMSDAVAAGPRGKLEPSGSERDTTLLALALNLF